MRAVQKIGLVILATSEMAFFSVGFYFHPALVLIGLFLPIVGAMMYGWGKYEKNVLCPNCGTINPATYKKCTACGRRPFFVFYLNEKGRILGCVFSRREYLLRALAIEVAFVPIIIFCVAIGLWPMSVGLPLLLTTLIGGQYWKATKRQKPDYRGDAEQYQLVVDDSGETFFKKG